MLRNRLQWWVLVTTVEHKVENNMLMVEAHALSQLSFLKERKVRLCGHHAVSPFNL
jgi:hypothetical protein